MKSPQVSFYTPASNFACIIDTYDFLFYHICMDNHSNVYDAILTQLKSDDSIEPLKVANGYSLIDLIAISEEILIKETDNLLSDHQYQTNFLGFVSFLAEGLKAFKIEKNYDKVEFSKVFLQRLMDLLSKSEDKNV